MGSALHRAPCRCRRSVLVQAEKPDQPSDLESMFAEEIKRRGLDSVDMADIGRDSKGAATSTSTSKSPFQSATKTRTADTNVSGGDQRQRSIALVNEGLEGLIPRASELLKLGGSVFLAFVPFILAISLAFGGIYALFGEHFVHGGDSSYSRPAYLDPETLLSEPTVDPYIPYR